ncbi:RagB/SusD family nutrient uptake outer membrane protein [Pedobacter immunditicola]|uniref:RagB/SusD family nutrient uptake outer membrane protein n=1 Tax=Pedobacter immunditicola TaxID=3133440 RepID=UPI0030B4FBA4
MKPTKIIYLFSALLILMASCKKDFLEEKRDLGGANEEVFKDPLLAQAYVDYVYGMFLPANNGTPNVQHQTVNENGGYSSAFTQTTEEMAGETDFNKEWAQISYINNHALKYFGQRMGASIANNTWTRLKQINLFLENIDKHGIDEETKGKLKGQLYYWRAWQYFELVKLYGGVPLVLTSQNPIISSGENTQVPRSSSTETIDQICADLDSAITLLPGKWASTADWGRITSGASAALKGRVLLTWASPLFNRNDDRARWTRAYDANVAAKALLEQNGFGLYKKGTLANATAWGNMFLEEVNNPEAVMVFGFNNVASGNPQRNNGWEQAVRSKEINGAGSISPTKQMVDAFPMKDGKMAGASTYPYSDQKFYKNRDPRFYKTFIYNGALWPYKEAANFRQWTYTWKSNASRVVPDKTTETKGANSSGIYLCKATGASGSNAIGDFKLSSTDFMEIRFAEVVLNLAESAIGADKIGEGMEGIKSIRERAGVENLDGSYGLAGITGRDNAFAAALNERKVEFAYEGKRFWDLRRWMLFSDEFGTLTRLKMSPLNETRRTGFYISVKTAAGADYVGANDPLIKISNNPAIVIEREPTALPAGFANYDAYLDHLYDKHFKVTVKDDLDKTSPANWKFKWYKEYYFFGINQTALSGSPYLEQTQGWNSLTGSGTFDPLK